MKLLCFEFDKLQVFEHQMDKNKLNETKTTPILQKCYPCLKTRESFLMETPYTEFNIFSNIHNPPNLYFDIDLLAQNTRSLRL